MFLASCTPLYHESVHMVFGRSVRARYASALLPRVPGLVQSRYGSGGEAMSRHVLRVITYHRVLDGGASTVCNPSLVSATPAGFEQQMRFLARRYRVVSGDEVVAAYREGRRLPIVRP